MFISKKLFKIFALIAVITPLAMIGCKGHGRGMGPEKLDKIESRITSKLDLNEVQKQKLANLKAEIKKIMEEKKPDRSADLDFALTQIKSERLNTAEIKDFLKKKQANHEELFDRVAPLVADFHASLSTEQKSKMAGQLEKMKEHFTSEE